MHLKRRGLSDVVVTILIILVALAAVSIIWAAVRPAIQDATSNIDTQNLNANLKITEQVLVDGANDQITLKIRREAAPTEISGEITAINVVLEDSSGNSEVIRDDSVQIKELETKTITVSYSGTGIDQVSDSIVRVSVAPIFSNPDGSESPGDISHTVQGSDIGVSSPPAAVCGNNILESGEQCDDGNTVTESCSYGQTSCNVCSSTCQTIPGQTSYCSDGVVDSTNGEQCDDGNTNNNDACTNTCKNAVCGDGIIYIGSESCDNGTSNGQPNKCNNSCTGTTTPACGNNVKESGEDCDGTDLGGATCQSVDSSFNGGTLGCSSCSYDTSSCFSGGL